METNFIETWFQEKKNWITDEDIAEVRRKQREKRKITEELTGYKIIFFTPTTNKEELKPIQKKKNNWILF